MSLVNIALKYAKLNWSVIPLVPTQKFPPKGITWKDRQTKRATQEEIIAWWRKHPEAQIGIVTGKISDLDVIDFDGSGAIERFESKICNLPQTIMQSTGRLDGGTHALFKYHGGNCGLRTRPNYLEGVDFKTDGGIVVVHPSLHKSGKNYQWMNINPLEHGLDDLLEMPIEVVKFFASQNGNRHSNSKPLTPQPVKRGERNSTLTRLVGKWIGKGLDLEAAYLLAVGWNTTLEEPLDLREVEAVVKSIFNIDARKYPERHNKTKVNLRNTSEMSFAFPFEVMTGAAGYFTNVYSQYMEAPEPFLFMGYLTALGATLSKDLTIASILKTQPRLFTVLVGESATDRKSTTLNIVTEHFLNVINGFCSCWGIGSAEGLQKILKKAADEEHLPGTLLVFDELKSFVNKCKIESSVLLPCVNTLFESNRYESHTKKQSIIIEKAHLSLLGASTLNTYQRIYNDVFIDIGFPNRVFLVVSTANRQFSFPEKIPVSEFHTMQDNLIRILQHIDNGLELNINQEAKQRYDQWYKNIEQSIHAKRLDTYSLRLMMLLAVNNLKSEIDLVTTEHAISLCNWQLQIRKLYDPIDADTVNAKVEESIRRALKQKGPLKNRDLKRYINVYRHGLWFYEISLKNMLKAKEIAWDQKNKSWHLTENTQLE
jgi:hypothetical protein